MKCFAETDKEYRKAWETMSHLRNSGKSIAWRDMKYVGVVAVGGCYSVAKSCPTLRNPMDCSTPGFPVLHYLPEFAQTHVWRVDDAIQVAHPLSPASPALNLSQHQGLFQWVKALHIKWPKYWSFSFNWLITVDYKLLSKGFVFYLLLYLK